MTLTSRAIAFASQRFPKLSSRVLASSGYTLDLGAFGPDAFQPWKDETAERQDRAWTPLVDAAIAGSPREDIAALFGALDALPAGVESLLEVGCGGGYNSALIAHHRPGIRYAGVDLSESMVEISRRKYPQRSFSVADATNLSFSKNEFDVVMDGVALLHIPAWREAISEYARVASKAVILHGLTLTDRPTTPFAKYAYGQPSREFVFNRDDVLGAVADAGLTVQSVHPGDDYDLTEYLGIPTVSETWVLSR